VAAPPVEPALVVASLEPAAPPVSLLEPAAPVVAPPVPDPAPLVVVVAVVAPLDPTSPALPKRELTSDPQAAIETNAKPAQMGSKVILFEVMGSS